MPSNPSNNATEVLIDAVCKARETSLTRYERALYAAIQNWLSRYNPLSKGLCCKRRHLLRLQASLSRHRSHLPIAHVFLRIVQVASFQTRDHSAECQMVSPL